MGVIREHSRVVLLTALPDEGLAAGDIGTVVHGYRDGRAYEVEFVTLTGETVCVVTLEVGQIRPVHQRELASARELLAA